MSNDVQLIGGTVIAGTARAGKAVAVVDLQMAMRSPAARRLLILMRLSKPSVDLARYQATGLLLDEHCLLES